MIQKLPVEMGWFWVGGGDLLDAMRERVKIRHQESRLQFVGEQTNPFPWYKNGDLFVLTSAFEGFPNVLVEAMSFGMVPVAFDCPSGPAEIIEEGKSGFLIPLGRWVRMVDKIRQLQEDPKMRLAMGDEAIRRSRKFDQSAILKKWKQVIIR